MARTPLAKQDTENSDALAEATCPRARSGKTTPVSAQQARRRRWSKRSSTETSDALRLELRRRASRCAIRRTIAAFQLQCARAERSKRRKANPYRSALSMLTFYINRAGKNLPPSRRKMLDRAKDELNVQFGKHDRVCTSFPAIISTGKRSEYLTEQCHRSHSTGIVAPAVPAYPWTDTESGTWMRRRDGSRAFCRPSRSANCWSASSRRCFIATPAPRSRMPGMAAAASAARSAKNSCARAARSPARP